MTTTMRAQLRLVVCVPPMSTLAYGARLTATFFNHTATTLLQNCTASKHHTLHYSGAHYVHRRTQELAEAIICHLCVDGTAIELGSKHGMQSCSYAAECRVVGNVDDVKRIKVRHRSCRRSVPTVVVPEHNVRYRSFGRSQHHSRTTNKHTRG